MIYQLVTETLGGRSKRELSFVQDYVTALRYKCCNIFHCSPENNKRTSPLNKKVKFVIVVFHTMYGDLSDLNDGRDGWGVKGCTIFFQQTSRSQTLFNKHGTTSRVITTPTLVSRPRVLVDRASVGGEIGCRHRTLNYMKVHSKSYTL